MSNGDEIRLRLILSKRQLRMLLVLALMIGAAYAVMSETVTMTTTYPSPSGIYTQLITTGSSFFARDGGGVGVGTTAPAAKLDVAGNIRIADGTQAAGSVLTSNAQGLGSRKAPSSSYVAVFKPAGTGTYTINLVTGQTSGGTLAFLSGKPFPAGSTAIGVAAMAAYNVGFCQQSNGETATVNGAATAVIADPAAIKFKDSSYGCAGTGATSSAVFFGFPPAGP